MLRQRWSEDEWQTAHKSLRCRGVRGVGFALWLVVGLTGGRNTIRLERRDVGARAVCVKTLGEFGLHVLGQHPVGEERRRGGVPGSRRKAIELGERAVREVRAAL